jgi:RNA polymerase sigma-70 factor, ECF subfamily
MGNEGTPFAAMVRRLLDSLEAPDGGTVVVRWTDGRCDHGTVWDHSLERMLLQSACAGDDDALDLLLRREWFGVYRLVVVSEPDGRRAEELVQEVFARAIAALPRLRDGGVPFRSSVAQIARRLLRDRQPTSPPIGGPRGVPGAFGEPEPPDLVVLPAQASSAEDPDPSCSQPSVMVLSADDRPRVVAALDRLPRHCRELLWLRIVEGHTETEIGVEWGRTPDAVRELQRRALRALRAGLDAEALDDELLDAATPGADVLETDRGGPPDPSPDGRS